MAQTRTMATLDLVGGSLPLDLTNTVNSRVVPEHDYLGSYRDLAAWLERVSVLTPGQKDSLTAQAHMDASGAAAALRAATAMRDVVHTVFGSLARDEEPPRDALRELLTGYAEAIYLATWERTADGLRPSWNVASDLLAPLRPIAHQAVVLLMSPDISHVKSCPGCGWLFVDATRNHSRRWCDMATCGSRAKMRRYHQRHRSHSG